VNKLIAPAILVALGCATAALAGDRAATDDARQSCALDLLRARNDHPRARVIEAKGLEIEITSDVVLRSCCMPSRLVVAGDITNTGAQPLEYVKMILSFEDENGRVVEAEIGYNHKAESLGDDEQLKRLLHETPHYDPIPPGGSDKFSIGVAMPLLPHYSKVELLSVQVRERDKLSAR